LMIFDGVSAENAALNGTNKKTITEMMTAHRFIVAPWGRHDTPRLSQAR
jgi:hypothetical protein